MTAPRSGWPLLILLVLAGCAPVAPPAVPPGPDAFAEVVAAERAFAQHSVERGSREAFLTWLADSAVLFRPAPVNGPQAVRAEPVSPNRLEWEPAYAGVAGSGELAFSTGPWESRSAAGELRGRGHFLTLWRRQADGRWRVELDHGIAYPEPGAERLGAGTVRRREPVRGAEALFTLHAAETLQAAEDSLAAATAAHGMLAAFATALAADARAYRVNHLPADGTRAVLELIAGGPPRLTWRAQRVHVATSGDLGYTYGGYRTPGAAADTGGYIHVWTRDESGAWRILFQMMTPYPPR